MEEITIETLEWSAPEYNHTDKNIDWFWTVGIVAFVAMLAAIWLGNYVFAIFIVMSGFLLIMFNARQPKDSIFSISSEGIRMGTNLYDFKNINGFNIKKGPVWGKLIIETK